MKILIVDNIVTQLNILENILKQLGYGDIRKAKSVKEATEAIAKEPDIAIAICEWDLPEKSGLDLFQIIQSNQKLKAIQFFLSFRVKSKEEILQVSKVGIVNFIIKPYSLDTVKQKLLRITSQISKPASPSKAASDNLDELMKTIEDNLGQNPTT